MKNIYVFLFSVAFCLPAMQASELLSNHFNLPTTSASELSVISWDLNNFSEERGETEIEFIAKTIQKFDVIVIQNVSPTKQGEKGIATLVKELNKKGVRCDYRISETTTSYADYQCKSYAYIWRPSKARLIAEPWLDRDFENKICREPYLARFNVNGKDILFINYFAHSHPDSSLKEITHFSQYPELYPNDRIVISGNFNANSTNAVFNPLRISGFTPNLEGMPTGLCQKCGQNEEYLTGAHDFILFDRRALRILRTGVTDFIRNCLLLPNAVKISNRLPVWVVLGV